MVTLSFTIFSGQKNYNRAHMLFQVLCGFEPIFYTTHPNEESIKIIFKGAIRNNLTINDYDLCSILNNLLDNALEYSAKNNFSTVWLNIYLEASVLLIDVVNNISAPIDISKFSSTTKADNINHGFGLAIVKETVHYYNGSLKYELSESQITAKVRLFTVA